MSDDLRAQIAQAAIEWMEKEYGGSDPKAASDITDAILPLVEQAIREEREKWQAEHEGPWWATELAAEGADTKTALAELRKEFTELSEYHAATTIDRAQEVAEKDKQIRDIWARMMKAESALAEIRNAQQAQVSSTERERLARLRDTPAPPQEPG